MAIKFMFLCEKMAEREGFEPSVFLGISMGYKGIVSRSCLTEAEQYPNFGYLIVL